MKVLENDAIVSTFTDFLYKVEPFSARRERGRHLWVEVFLSNRQKLSAMHSRILFGMKLASPGLSWKRSHQS
jgi:hypothetical protein